MLCNEWKWDCGKCKGLDGLPTFALFPLALSWVFVFFEHPVPEHLGRSWWALAKKDNCRSGCCAFSGLGLLRQTTYNAPPGGGQVQMAKAVPGTCCNWHLKTESFDQPHWRRSVKRTVRLILPQEVAEIRRNCHYKCAARGKIFWGLAYANYK